jgi:hypothetical protein
MIWLIEFITQDNDVLSVAFDDLPSDMEIQEYVDNHDWLSMEESVEWTVDSIPLISLKSS